MTAYFLDTSATVKRYAVETGSRWITTLTDLSSRNQCSLANITRVEIVAAFYFKMRTGQLTRAQAQQAESVFRSEMRSHFRLVQGGIAILHRAMRLVAAHPLRAYDAVQLAAALVLQMQRRPFSLTGPIFVSADQALNQAAAAEGLQVDDPNQHP